MSRGELGAALLGIGLQGDHGFVPARIDLDLTHLPGLIVCGQTGAQDFFNRRQRAGVTSLTRRAVGNRDGLDRGGSGEIAGFNPFADHQLAFAQTNHGGFGGRAQTILLSDAVLLGTQQAIDPWLHRPLGIQLGAASALKLLQRARHGGQHRPHLSQQLSEAPPLPAGAQRH